MKSIQYRNVPFQLSRRKTQNPIDTKFIFALSQNYVIACNALTQVAIKTKKINNRRNYHIQYEKKQPHFLYRNIDGIKHTHSST